MMPLGTRVIPPDDSLERRIEAALEDELDRQARAGMSVLADRGLGLFGEGGVDGTCVMTMKDAARVAAKEALRWF